MTCIVSIVDKDNNIHVGSDSLASDDHSQTIMTAAKIFMCGEMVVGFAGSFRAAQVFQHAMTLPERGELAEDMEYLTTSFISALREAFMMAGLLPMEGIGEEAFEGEFLLGYRGKIYRMQEDFSILHAVDDFLSIGSGGEAASAVLFATKKLEMTPHERMLLSLEATSYQITSVKPPYHFFSIDEDGEEIGGEKEEEEMDAGVKAYKTEMERVTMKTPVHKKPTPAIPTDEPKKGECSDDYRSCPDGQIYSIDKMCCEDKPQTPIRGVDTVHTTEQDEGLNND